MKKILLLTLVAMCMALVSRAADVFEEETWLLTGTVGRGMLVYDKIDYDGAVPLISLTGEYCVVSDVFSKGGAVGVGAYFGYTSYGAKQPEYEGYLLDDFVVGARGTFHFQFVNRLDTYAGCVLGARIPFVRYDGDSKEFDEKARFAASAFLGASYFFFENFGLCAEVGYGIAYANVGIVLRWGN